MRTLVLLAALLVAPAAAAQPTAPADSLLEVFIGAVGYDRFEASWGVGDMPYIPNDVPDSERIRATWSSLLTLDWIRRQLRANYLATTSPEAVQAMIDWLDTPGVRDALAHDYAAAQRAETGRAEWARRAYAAGALGARRTAAIDRIARAAGDGLPDAQYALDTMRALVVHVARTEDGLTPTPEEVGFYVDGFREDIMDEAREDQRLVVAARFADYPIEGLEAYARALETAAGADYLRLVVDAVLAVRLDALRLALDSVAG